MATSNTGYTIVAIPSDDDKIWNLSSEKIPHLTLLFLGDRLENIGRVENFIEHAVNTSLNRFSLMVDHRGVLGDQSADVLFFGDYGTKSLKDFRYHLLTNLDIQTAYNSVEQYPTWIPHLTLGYPKTPAKVDTKEYPYSVTFDRIALWTGDYEGAEFSLKNNDMDAVALSMSAIGKKFLEHYGVKGMKWGVHKSDIARAAQLGVEAVGSRKGKTQTHDIIKRVRESGGVRNISDKDLENMLRRMDLESRYSRLSSQHKKEITKGRTATLKFLGEVGKIALPIILGGAVAKAATSPAAYRTYATVTRKAIGR